MRDGRGCDRLRGRFRDPWAGAGLAPAIRSSLRKKIAPCSKPLPAPHHPEPLPCLLKIINLKNERKNFKFKKPKQPPIKSLRIKTQFNQPANKNAYWLIKEKIPDKFSIAKYRENLLREEIVIIEKLKSKSTHWRTHLNPRDPCARMIM